MKAIILTAGYGNRMRPLTKNTHKTLLTVAGTTILKRIIDGLIDNNINDILIVTGFRADDIKNYLAITYPQIPFSFVHNERFSQTNNIFSLALAFDSLDTIETDILVIESDLIYDKSIIGRILRSSYSNVALVDKFRSGMDGTVVTVKNDIISAVIPPHLQDDNFDFSDKYKTLNIYKFSKEFCQTSFKKLLSYYAHVIDNNCYYELILGILIYMQKETVHAEIIESEKWAEVDDPNDVAVAEFTFHQNRKSLLESIMGGYWNFDVLDFCFIRNMYFPDSSLISEMKNNLHNVIHNYGSKQSILNKKMSWLLLCNPSHVITLNGASQIYPLLKQWCSGKTALIPNPTFGDYTRIFSLTDSYIDSGSFNLCEITQKAKENDCIVFVNPNNPTGTGIQTDWIYSFAQDHLKKLIIVDESFIEFSNEPSMITLLEKKSLDNIIVIKSLSKSLGIPGVRLGFCYSTNRQFNSYIHEYIPIWNMNSLAEFCLEIFLKHRIDLKNSITLTNNDRFNFLQELKTIPFFQTVFPSEANFILVKLRTDVCAGKIVDYLLQNESIFIKDVTFKFNTQCNYLRFAVRLPAENQRCITALHSLPIHEMQK